jgi:hypothetical protein
MSKRPGPPPERILSYAAEVETLVTWIVIAHVSSGREGFGLLLRYAADRVPVEQKIKMLQEIVTTYDDIPNPYDGFFEDLKLINDVRVRVAHSVHMRTGLVPQGRYVSFRRGGAMSVPEHELRDQVGLAMRRKEKLRKAIGSISKAVGVGEMFGEQPMPN